MIALTYLSAIRFSGADAGSFLHNQLSADVLALAPDESVFACYCEPRGRVLALLLVHRSHAGYYAIVSRSLVASIAKRLMIYVLRAKVNIEVLDGCAVTGFQAGAEPGPVAPTTEGLQTPPAHLAVVAVPDSDDRLLVGAADASVDTSAARQAAWKLAQLKRGIVWLCPATSGEFLPQMLGYEALGAVNFRKGCYPGQEIVARTHYLGKVKRHPRLLCTTAAIGPKPLDKIQITGAGQSYDAVITDCGHRQDGGSCMHVVTRMDPDLAVEQIEYQGQIIPLV